MGLVFKVTQKHNISFQIQFENNQISIVFFWVVTYKNFKYSNLNIQPETNKAEDCYHHAWESMQID